MVLGSVHSGTWKRLYFTFFRGELISTRRPSGIAAANNKSRINRDCPPTWGREGPGRRFSPGRWGRGQCPPGPGHPAHPSPRHVPGRAALTARPPRELPPRPPYRAPGQAWRPASPARSAGPRRRRRYRCAQRARAAGRRCPAPAVSASPALPQAARGGAERQEAAPLKPVSAAPDQTARPSRGAGSEGRRGGAGSDVTPAPSWPIGGGARGAGLRVPGKGTGGRGRPGIPGVPAVNIFWRPRAAAGCRAYTRVRDLVAFLGWFAKPLEDDQM